MNEAYEDAKHAHEREILLDKGARFRFDSLDRDKRVVHLTMVGPEEPEVEATPEEPAAESEAAQDASIYEIAY